MLTQAITGTERIIKEVEKDAKRARYAARNALNESAKIAVKDEKAGMRKAFDRPTPFILNSIRVTQYAKPDNLMVTVGFKDVFTRNGYDPVYETLSPHIKGGRRSQKPAERMLRRAGILNSNEYLVPSRTAPLNRYGNITKGTMGKILSDLSAHRAAGYSANRRWNKKRQYIIGQVGTTRGIFKISGGYNKASTGRWSLVFIVVKGAPNYRKRYDFYGIAERSVFQNIENEYEKAAREIKW